MQHWTSYEAPDWLASLAALKRADSTSLHVHERHDSDGLLASFSTYTACCWLLKVPQVHDTHRSSSCVPLLIPNGRDANMKILRQCGCYLQDDWSAEEALCGRSGTLLRSVGEQCRHPGQLQKRLSSSSQPAPHSHFDCGPKFPIGRPARA